MRPRAELTINSKNADLAYCFSRILTIFFSNNDSHSFINVVLNFTLEQNLKKMLGLKYYLKLIVAQFIGIS